MNDVLPTREQINEACVYYRNDYDQLNADEQEMIRLNALTWLNAWRKALQCRTKSC